MKAALTAAELVTPTSTLYHPVLVVENGVITALSTRDRMEIPVAAHHFDFPGAVIAPGFIDVHIHGSAAFDVMKASPSELVEMQEFLLTKGVVAYCPTTVTASKDTTLKALERLGKAIKK